MEQWSRAWKPHDTFKKELMPKAPIQAHKGRFSQTNPNSVEEEVLEGCLLVGSDVHGRRHRGFCQDLSCPPTAAHQWPPQRRKPWGRPAHTKATDPPPATVSRSMPLASHRHEKDTSSARSFTRRGPREAVGVRRRIQPPLSSPSIGSPVSSSDGSRAEAWKRGPKTKKTVPPVSPPLTRATQGAFGKHPPFHTQKKSIVP